ncbi:uncharacterized protein LOC121871873 [Homarus americanus]|uniref:uncharacterized protein LOC121871873 n=1 Tax=Homarus americanus TaxID=6706 RepID=UPI001C43AD84|nr:uncharacterized protein LOC121871873 [Homarus americanus]
MPLPLGSRFFLLFCGFFSSLDEGFIPSMSSMDSEVPGGNTLSVSQEQYFEDVISLQENGGKTADVDEEEAPENGVLDYLSHLQSQIRQALKSLPCLMTGKRTSESAGGAQKKRRQSITFETKMKIIMQYKNGKL